MRASRDVFRSSPWCGIVGRITVKIWILVGVVLLPTEAASQSLFVRGGYAREIKRFSGEPGTSVLDTEASGLDVAVGTSITSRCTVALEIGWTERSSVTKTTVV